MLRLVCTKQKHRASPFPFSHGYFLFSTSIRKPIIVLSNLSDQQSFTVSYLQKSCGLSSESAISLAKKLRIEATHNPDSVLSLFKTHGLTQRHIKNLITKRPGLLLADLDTKLGPNMMLFKSLGFSGASLAKMLSKHPRVLESDAQTVFELFRSHGFSEKDIKNLTMRLPKLLIYDAKKTIKPKIEFLKSLGLPELHIAKILSHEPYVLTRSLENHIIPCVQALMRFLGSDVSASKAIKGCHRMLEFNLEKVLHPNVSIFRSHGVPESLIVKMFLINPRTLLLRGSRVSEIIGDVKELGFDPNEVLFALAVCTMARMSKELWEQKLETYRSIGLSKDEIYSAFRKQPLCMINSVKKIHKLMSFFMNKLNMKPSMISKNPDLLLLSLEKRIIPRCSVLQLLLSQGFIKEDVIKFPYVLKMTDKSFRQRILSKYEAAAPDIVKAYKGKIEFQGFSSSFNVLVTNYDGIE
ncbi:transcription termination factor MTERF6 chloroplastic/mitochondrial [Prunus yedoensis var. nudiflora]|uniref:Transcription termination factor MTERF6 chloroplastic/mitochondrial n=1 Tax=Prunus yedoensis var. nudiflora TaxID=2094558 RepID=A0A314XSX1_PRUYE|nr:transcription termination factor MTERF6 chloroplastic/mitochondrial [Prunus yedoensis var. nudiflora]